MDAAITNTSPITNSPSGVPPEPPEAHHQAGAKGQGAEGGEQAKGRGAARAHSAWRGGAADDATVIEIVEPAEACDRVTTEVIDDAAEFFAPVATDLVDNLIGRYQDLRARISRMAEAIAANPAAVAYFLDGNFNDRRASIPAVPALFAEKGAIAALNADYWSKALAMTDVYDCMPQARRDEWNKAIREKTAPDFEAETVRATLLELLASRTKFFAERVDGIFRGLSGEHVTNTPEGFGKRMIMAYVWSGHGPFMHLDTSRAGLINDLRCVVAKFMGRDEPQYHASDALLESLRANTGVWHAIDGGAIRIRVYLKGTAHVEVHPDMAWRLNAVLANLYPLAIPAQFRQRPAKRTKDFVLLGRPLPFVVLAVIPRPRMDGRARQMRLDSHYSDPAVYAEAVKVIEALGGSVDEGGRLTFDYPADEVLRELHLSECIPDRVAHQYYPTPEKLARLAAEAADVGPGHKVLEPSAGQGHLAGFLPKDRTTCVEVAPLHAAVLKAPGLHDGRGGLPGLGCPAACRLRPRRDEPALQRRSRAAAHQGRG